MPRSRYSAVEKLALVTEFQNSNLSAGVFGKQYKMEACTIERWSLRYQRDGIDGLAEATKSQHYSQTFKQKIIRAYLNGEETIQGLTNKYRCRSTSQLINWLIKYNRDQIVTASPSRKQVPKMSRKTAFNERVEIVEWINKGAHSYSEVAEHFQVSYQRAQSWALKTKEKGFEALVDKPWSSQTRIRVNGTG